MPFLIVEELNKNHRIVCVVDTKDADAAIAKAAEHFNDSTLVFKADARYVSELEYADMLSNYEGLKRKI